MFLHHDLLPDSNWNKIRKLFRGTILKFQLNGRERDFVRSVALDELKLDTETDHVVSAIYKRDIITVLSDVYSDFHNFVLEVGEKANPSKVIK